jgi:hypothetical protein
MCHFILLGIFVIGRFECIYDVIQLQYFADLAGASWCPPKQVNVDRYLIGGIAFGDLAATGRMRQIHCACELKAI